MAWVAIREFGPELGQLPEQLFGAEAPGIAEVIELQEHPVVTGKEYYINQDSLV